MSTRKPLSVQLYSVRDYAAKDFKATLKRIADIGFVGVEPAGFFDMRPSDFRKTIEDLGLKLYSSHTPWVRGDFIGEAMETADILGLKRVVCGYSAADFADMDSIKRTADRVNLIQEKLEKNGFELFQHNHYWEFERIDGRLKYEIFAELCPKVKFELDCYWSTNKGREDAVAVMKPFAERTILVHMKDGVCRQEAKNAGMVNGLLDMKVDLLPLGEGDLPIPQLMQVLPEQVETVVVELDYCDSVEMFEALRRSYDYMTRNGFAYGNK